MTTLPALSPEKVARKRGRRGGCRKKRSGLRKNRSKSDRLRKKNLAICYWNCSSVKQRGRDLEKLVYETDIMMLQETNVENFKCPGYKTYTNPCSETHHGQLILVKQGVTHRLIDAKRFNREDREVQIMECEVRKRKWTLVNLYVGNDSAKKEEDWDFLEELGQLSERVMIVGDFNARSVTWGNVRDNIQGKALEKAMVESSFSILNGTYMTRIAQRNGEDDSNIDLALITAGLEVLTKWQALSDHGSDHLPCSVMINCHEGKDEVCRRKKPFRYGKDSGSIVLQKIRRKVWAARPTQSNFVQPPYWNPVLEELWLQKRMSTRAWHRARKSDKVSDKEKNTLRERMKRDGRLFRESANEAKQMRWEQYVTEVSSEKALHKFWKLHRKMKGLRTDVGSVSVKDENDRLLETDEAKGRAFLERYIKQTHHGNKEERANIRATMKTAVPEGLYGEGVTVQEVKQVISGTKDSAAGPDGVRYSHFKDADEEDLQGMVEDFNESLATGKIPEEWLHSYLMPLPKPGKDHSNIKGYRIITMQNTYGKILEKIVAKRLANYLEREKLLPDGLGSYRPGKDTCTNTAVLAFDVFEGFQRKEETVMAAIDLEDAYNRVDYGKLMDLLMEMNVDPWLVQWISEALFERKVALRSGRWMSDPVEIASGLPQGSALSPVLFNIYTSKIARIDVSGAGRILTFADDVMVYGQGRDRLAVGRMLQDGLNRVADWCEEYNAVINPEKAQVIWCSLNNRIVKEPTPPIVFDHSLIDRQHELKYLGITLDRTLSFRKHIDNVAVRAQKGINVVKTLASAGIQQRVLFLLMQLVVLSVIDYGLGILSLSKTQIDRLERVQNAAMRAVLGCTKDTHVVCMRYILDLASIRVRHKVAQVKLYLNVLGDPKHPLHGSLSSIKGKRIKRGSSWMAEAEESLRKVCDIEEICSGREWFELSPDCRSLANVHITMGRERRECAAVINDNDIRQLIEEHSKPEDPVIYTDGSVRRGERSGWGFVVYSRNKRVHSMSGAIERTTSSMKMEIEAVTRALGWLQDARPRTTHLIIVTDSQSILRRVEKGLLRSEWMNPIQHTSLRAITWIFCPGHSGVKGNEEADRLAGSAVVDGQVKFDKGEVLKTLEEKLRDEEDRETAEHHAISRMWEMGIERGEGRKERLSGKERRRHNQTATGTISMDTLRALMLRGTEHVWTCPVCNDVVAQDK